ncbi:Glutaconyl-CoA decarboxylase subunit gamma [Sporomusa carbonis]|uniref:biotin/lipoyl-containing protein n=1 Tax=Sporomusa carbonis TaxID=3076075 RepID=UPI003A61A9D9
MRKFKVNVNGILYNVEAQEERLIVAAAPIAQAATPTALASAPAQTITPVEFVAGDSPVKAPMPGKITKIIAQEGDIVNKGDVLMLLEAMKMQNEIGAPAGGTVKFINVTNGQSVKPGEVIAVISQL